MPNIFETSTDELANSRSLLFHGLERLNQYDPDLSRILSDEARRQETTLSLVASYSSALPEVLVCVGDSINNITTEGYPGKRFHAGCKYVDEIENLAIERAKIAFSADYANVQPLSGSAANLAVLFALLEPGDTIMGLSLDSGGHLTHGSPVSFSGQFYNGVTYHLDASGFFDYEAISAIARKYMPKLIICGASAYSRKINFARFRVIADEVGAFLLADISHIAGLVAAGLHENPINYAHVVTTSTYKQLYGPRGGLILSGKDSVKKLPNGLTIAQSINKAVFPGVQGTPQPSAIAGKAASFQFITTPVFKVIANKIITFADQIANYFIDRDYHVISNGTDNHIVMIDTLNSIGMTGYIAEKAFEECGIIVNKNTIPSDLKSPFITSGIRLGTNDLALRNLTSENIDWLCQLLKEILESIEVKGDKTYFVQPNAIERYKKNIVEFCKKHPVCTYALERKNVECV
ncbi:MAG: serine hydroxymethyltransferase [Legionellaceae bacterium]|nr:serine hydroxymethyltransferase [Legionellaceae bacterium]